MNGDLLVFVVLGVAFAAVGLHLFFYSRRKAAVVRGFAQSRGCALMEKDDGSLEAELGRAFRIDDAGCVREFGQIRDVVSLPTATMFRAVELIDLNPHARAENTHHARAAVLFQGAPKWSGIFHVTPGLVAHQRYPLEARSAAEDVSGLFAESGMPAPPHALSITFMRGHGLAYLEPLVTGSVTEEDLTYLAEFAARLGDHFNDARVGGGALDRD